MEPDNKLYDNERWQLFGWVLSLNNGFLATVREIPGTTEMRLVTISINFMLEVRILAGISDRLHFTNAYVCICFYSEI